jgi:hypothetical protein
MVKHLIYYVISMFFATFITGCMEEDDFYYTSKSKMVRNVEPVSGEATSSSGHRIILDEQISGFRVLPATGAGYIAPCGWIHIAIDGGAKYTNYKRYSQGDTRASFPNALLVGTHSYQAIYRPATDTSQCSVVQTLPPPDAPFYFSGQLTTEYYEEVNDLGNPYNVGDGVPAWCDKNHPNHEHMISIKGAGWCKVLTSPYSYPKRCGERWGCTIFLGYSTRFDGGFILLDPFLGPGNGGYQDVGPSMINHRIIIGSNLCLSEADEAFGGITQWLADAEGDLIVCPGWPTDDYEKKSSCNVQNDFCNSPFLH